MKPHTSPVLTAELGHQSELLTHESARPLTATGRPLHLLIVEDSSSDAELILLALQQGGYNPTWERVETEEGLRGALTVGPWDIVTSAYILPGFGGAAALQVVRVAQPDLPFILVSETVGVDAAVAMMRAGANDYIRKHDIARLAQAIERELWESDNRRAKRAAERTTAHLAALIESSDDAIISKTLDGVITSWNSSAERVYGWRAAEAIGRNVSILVPPDKAYELAEIMRRLRAGVRMDYFETVRLHRDGRRIDVSLTISPVRDADGRLIGVSKTARDVQERKRAEENLRASDEQHRAMVESIPAMVWVSDTAGRPLLHNRHWYEYTGQSPEDTTSDHWQAVLHPDDATEAIARWERCKASGTPFALEYRLRRADGVYRWFLSKKTVIMGSGGIEQWVGICTDIDDRKRAEESLALSEARYRRLFETAQDGILIVDAVSRRIFDVNPFLVHLLGYQREELIGKELWEIGLFRDIEANKDAFLMLQEKCYVRYDDLPLSAKDGHSIDVEFVSNVYDVGHTRVIQCNIRDITGRKRAADDLQLRDRAIRAATQGLLITDACKLDHPIVYVSPGFERMTGYSSEEVLGRNCRLLQGKDTDPGEVSRIHKAVETGESCSVELLNYRKDGSQFWNELSISPVRDAAGGLTHFVGVQADVTARRSLEDQFRQSQKMEAIGQLAGGVAHDFNNLLTVINGYGELLLESLPAGDPSRESIREIVGAGGQAAGLTRQLLAFSRKAIIEPKALDLKVVVADVERMIRRIVGEDIHLAVANDPEAGEVKADPGQIEQVILNLVVNARDAMPRGGRLTIEVRNAILDETYTRTHADTRPGPYVLLAVTDSGCGMDIATLARIFEPFFTTKGNLGTGLGLATVHGIVRQSGGHVAVYSEVGHGTTFKVYLPRIEKQRSAPKPPSDRSVMPRGGETILMVEDDDGVRALTRLIVQGSGYTVLEARDGVEAVRLAEEHGGPIDLLITDVVMPKMDGREVAGRVLELHPEVKVLFLSGYTNDAIVRHGILHETVNFLQKPFSPVSLAVKIRTILNSSTANRQ